MSTFLGGGSGGRIGVYAVNNDFVGTYSAQGDVGPSEFGTGGPGSVYVESGQEVANTLFVAFTIDNANGQQHNYLTLDEEERDIIFTNLYISNYAKFQIIEDGEERTLRVDKVSFIFGLVIFFFLPIV